MLIIGLAGKKRAGKDTAATYLKNEFDLQNFSFAAPIRHVVANILGLSHEDALESFGKETPVSWLDGITPRRMMQTLGTEWGRAIHPELWIRSLFKRMDAAEKAYERKHAKIEGAVISDVRFENECRAIKERGGYIVRLIRPQTETSDSHVSELALPKELIDIDVINDSSLSDLYRSLDFVMQIIKEKEAE